MDVKKVLIIGFGRMGLTHYSILNMLLPGVEFHIIESNKRIRHLFKKNFNWLHFYSNESVLPKSNFDLTIITTPPFIHSELVERALKRKDKNIFVEKPFGGFMNDSVTYTGAVFVGYVLRFNPCVQWIKKNINPSDITRISGKYYSNTIESKPKGWRNGNYSGVLNEMGSHILDLFNFIVGLKGARVVNASIESIYSDTDDIVNAKLTNDNVIFELDLNWVDKRYRKPEFSLTIDLKNGEHFHLDQQKITKYSSGNEKEQISVATMPSNIPYYLRGIDFTLQMEKLISSREDLCDLNNALLVNCTMKNILNA